MGENDIGPERCQFRRVFADVGGVCPSPVSVNPHVAAHDPARLREPLQECSDPDLKFLVVRGCRQQHTYAPRALTVLRARVERPGRRRRRRAAPVRSLREGDRAKRKTARKG